MCTTLGNRQTVGRVETGNIGGRVCALLISKSEVSGSIVLCGQLLINIGPSLFSCLMIDTFCSFVDVVGICGIQFDGKFGTCHSWRSTLSSYRIYGQSWQAEWANHSKCRILRLNYL